MATKKFINDYTGNVYTVFSEFLAYYGATERYNKVLQNFADRKGYTQGQLFAHLNDIDKAIDNGHNPLVMSFRWQDDKKRDAAIYWATLAEKWNNLRFLREAKIDNDLTLFLHQHCCYYQFLYSVLRRVERQVFILGNGVTTLEDEFNRAKEYINKAGSKAISCAFLWVKFGAPTNKIEESKTEVEAFWCKISDNWEKFCAAKNNPPTLRTRKRYPRIQITDFSFKYAGYGHYEVRYTSPVTGKVWKHTTSNMPLIDCTLHTDNPRVKYLEQLRRQVKYNGCQIVVKP